MSLSLCSCLPKLAFDLSADEAAAALEAAGHFLAKFYSLQVSIYVNSTVLMASITVTGRKILLKFKEIAQCVSLAYQLPAINKCASIAVN